MLYTYNRPISETESEALHFFESKDVKVFPCSYRGTYTIEDSTSVAEYGFDPESCLNTENNFVNIPGFAGHNSYIKEFKNNILYCVIGGYYFEIKLESNLLAAKLDLLKDAYFYINLQKEVLVDKPFDLKYNFFVRFFL